MGFTDDCYTDGRVPSVRPSVIISPTDFIPVTDGCSPSIKLFNGVVRLLDMPSRYSCQDDQKMILAERGNHELTSKGRFEQFGWSVVDIDFHESFLLWHIATRFCRVGHTKSRLVKIRRFLAIYSK